MFQVHVRNWRAIFLRNAAFSFKNDANHAPIRNCKETEYSNAKKLSTQVSNKKLCIYERKRLIMKYILLSNKEIFR